MKANQLHQQKEAAYHALLTRANIAEKRVATVLKASAAEVDALELDENGKAVVLTNTDLKHKAASVSMRTLC